MPIYCGIRGLAKDEYKVGEERNAKWDTEHFSIEFVQFIDGGMLLDVANK
jgi:hypothetical protein